MRRIEGRESYVPQTEVFEAARVDLPQIVKIEKEAVVKAYPNADKKITASDLEATYKGGAHIWMEDLLSIEKGNKNKKIWVAKQDGEVIGICAASKSRDFFIDALYVSPEVQRSGAGTKLMEQVFEWAGPDEDINLEVVEYNEQAINFYKKFGFELRPSMKSEHSLAGGKSMPLVRMIRRVAKAA